MDFVIGSLKVLVGTFILFMVASSTYGALSKNGRGIWVGFVVMLAVANMAIHRLIGSTINPPFYTAVLFAITLAGLSPAREKVGPAFRQAIYGVVVGTLLGWAFYAEIASIG